MRRENHLNPRQYAFLRKMRAHPHGLPLEDWPRPAVLRRWMRREGFRAALESLRETFRMQADLMLAGASARAATMAHLILSGEGGVGRTLDEVAQWQQTLLAMARLVRVDHMRQRDCRERRDDVDTGDKVRADSNPGFVRRPDPSDPPREIAPAPTAFIEPVTAMVDHAA